MDTKEKTGILKVYVGETDKIHGRILFEEIVFEARNEGLAGATVYKGMMSFGASHSIHTMKIFALSEDLPVIIELVDNIEKLDEFAEKVNNMIDLSKKGGLITFQELDVVRYKRGQKYREEYH
jgi:PII-like signaling protein